MRRKRNRRVPNWPVILWAITALNVVFGLAYSRATAATIIKVTGARSEDHAQITKDSQFLRDVPCFRANKALFEEKIRFLPHVKSAELRRNLFGRAEILVQLRTPVATVGSNSLLDEDGVVYFAAPPPEQMPRIELDAGLSATAGFGSLYPLAKASDLAREVASRASLRGATIVLRRTGSVALKVVDGPVIELGRLEEIKQKMKAYDEQFAINSQLLEESLSLSFVDPARPTQKKKSK